MGSTLCAWKSTVEASIDGAPFRMTVRILPAAERDDLRALEGELNGRRSDQVDGDLLARCMAMLDRLVIDVSGLRFEWDEGDGDPTEPATLAELLDCLKRLSQETYALRWAELLEVCATEQYLSNHQKKISSSRLDSMRGLMAESLERNGASPPAAPSATPADSAASGAA